MNHQIGLALSGGGVRAIAQIGILKVLHENGIKPTVVAGTSGGAIVGALYAAGNDTQKMMEFFTKTPLFHWSKLALSKAGLLSPKKFIEDYKKYVPFENIEDLPIELRIVATDIVNGKEKIFDRGNLLNAVMASAAFPGVFQPVSIEGLLYADGGIFNNMPADVIRSRCKFLIGIDVNPITSVDQNSIDSAYEVLKRSLDLMMRHHTQKAKDFCDLFISPVEAEQYAIFDTGKIPELYQIGIEEGMKHLEVIRSIPIQF